MVAELGDSTDVRDWIGCLVRPVAEHLAALGSPTWFARFGAQVMTDPALRQIMVDESLSSPSLVRIVEGLHRCLPELPAEVRAERGDMARQLLVHMIAERERALAEGTPTPRASWHDAATGLIDALVGLWLAPVTHHEREKERERMKVTVDEDKCCGAGTCVLLAPDVFDQRDEDGIVVLLDEHAGRGPARHRPRGGERVPGRRDLGERA